MRIRIEFKIEDFWIGAFWRSTFDAVGPSRKDWVRATYDLWICLIPCFPLHLSWERPDRVQ